MIGTRTRNSASLQGQPWAVAAVGVCLLVAGCGPKTYPLQGRVVYAPDQAVAGDLAGYAVTAVCDDPPISAVGVVGSDGSFALSTFDNEDGAVEGVYRFALTPPLPYGDELPSPVVIAARYLDPATSGLEIEVPCEEAVLTVERAGTQQ